MHDTGTGMDAASFRVTADFAVDGVAAGENLAPQFKPASRGVWEWTFSKPVAAVTK